MQQIINYKRERDKYKLILIDEEINTLKTAVNAYKQAAESALCVGYDNDFIGLNKKVTEMKKRIENLEDEKCSCTKHNTG